ncbi:MAG TPA: phosphatase PAP2 family protein [Candidatus Limnocylindrales bacterium]|nr:phosphatase PAP2 family protein [Candidatus Limnocylindrales bacterium]
MLGLPVRASRAGGRPARRAEAPALTVAPHVAVARGRVANGVVGVCLLGFGALFWLVRTKRSEAFDVAWTLRLQRRRRRWLDALMTVVSWPGFPPQSRFVPSSLIALLAILRFPTEALFLGIAWGSAVLSSGLKALMRRPRPVAGTDLRVVAAPLGGSSFPSGHVLTFVGTYGFVAYLATTLIRDGLVRDVTTGTLVGLVALVGPSRIYQGHHWTTDVSASYLVGTAYLVVVVTAYRGVKERQLGSRTGR